MLIKVIIALLAVITIVYANALCDPDRTSPVIPDERLWELADASEYDEAIVLLDSIRGNSQETSFEMSDWYATAYLGKKDYDRAFETWKTGHEKGYFYLLHPRLPAYKDIAEIEEFVLLSQRDTELRTEAIAKSKSIKEVLLPEEYDPEKNYPLLICLHGGGSTIERARSHWQSEKLRSEFVVMLVQSYRHYSLKKFGWRSGDERARADIRTLFEQTVSEYSIDTARIIIGGVSAGGVMAIDIAVANVIPLVGFFGVCPGEPEALSIETATLMNNRNLSGFIVAGETDFYRERQNKMMSIFDEAHFPYEFHEIEGLGHGYPEDFESWIDRGLAYILSPSHRP